MIPTDRQERLISAILLLVACGCVLLGIALFFVGVAPYQLTLRLTSLATGSQNPINRAMYSILWRRMFVGGLFYSLIGFGLLFLRGRLVTRTAHVIKSLPVCVAEKRQSILHWLRSESQWHLISLGMITVGAILLRVVYLGEPPRIDESFTYVTFARRSIIHALTLYPAPNNHVLHTALVWISCRIFGNSLWAMRLPALVAGVALILVSYATGNRLAGRNAALFVAAFIAVSGSFVFYSVNARGYMQQALLLLVMVYLAAELVAGAPALYWVLFSAAAAAGFWTAPTMLYSYLIVSIWLVWEGGRIMLRPAIITSAITAVGVIFLYMPVIVVSGPAALFANPWVRAQPWQEFRADALAFPKRLLNLLHGSDPLFFLFIVGGGVLLGLVFRNPTGPHLRRLFLVMLMVVVSVPALQRIVPFPRALLPIFALYYLVAAVGCSVAVAKWFSSNEVGVLITVLLLVGVVAFHLTRSGYIEAHRDFPESEKLANYLARQLHPCDRVIISWSAGPELAWQLYHSNVPFLPYLNGTRAPGRIWVAMQERGVLPPATSRLDTSLFTLAGTLRDAGLNTGDYLPPTLISRIGRGEIFEMIPRFPMNCRNEESSAMKK